MPILDDVTVVATGRSRDNFANDHWLNAHRFARQAHEAESKYAGIFDGTYQDVRAPVVAAVVLSVASLEALANEIRFEPTQHFPNLPVRAVSAILEQADRAPLLDRFDFFCDLNDRPRFDRGTRPLQDVAVLVSFRNALVHFTPEWPTEQDAHRKLGEKLRGKFARSPYFPTEDEPLFPRAAMSYGCAKWAVESVRAFAVSYAASHGWQIGLEKAGRIAGDLP